MKTITIKTIEKKIINLEGDYNNILDIKKNLTELFNFDIECQQLIFQGKVLKDNDAIPDLDENKFIVLLLKKKKIIKNVEQISNEIQNKTVNVTESTTETNNGKVNSINDKLDENDKDDNEKIKQEIADKDDNEKIKQEIDDKDDNKIQIENNDEIQQNMNDETIVDENLVIELCNMGFDIDDVKRVLLFTKNNKDLAINLLMDPNNNDNLTDIQTLQNNPLSHGNLPQLSEEQFAQLIEQNPQEFQQMIGSLCQQFPELRQLMQNDPTMFMSTLRQILNNSVNSMDHAIAPNNVSGNNDQQINIQLSEEEEKKVSNLQSMFPNIPKITIVETLKACNEDEELSANLLFDF